MPMNDWICRACGTKNAANYDVCGGCGVRMFVHGAELDAPAADDSMTATRQEFFPISQPVAPGTRTRAQAFLNSHIWIKRGITLLLYVLAVGGAAIFWVASDFALMGFGIATIAIALFVASALEIELNFEERERDRMTK